MKTPYFTISKSKVLEQYKKISGLCDFVTYSSKTNSEVTKILETETTCQFSIHLHNELVNIKDFSRVIFLAQGWTQSQIIDLLEKGIHWIVVDNEQDLDNLLKVLDEWNGKINLLLRWRLKENTIKTEKYYVFGMRTKIIEHRIESLKTHSKIDKLGIHFHRKTQNIAEWNYKFELENSFNDETLNSIDIINMGGGLPSEYANTNMAVLDGIFKKILNFKEWLNGKNVSLMIEPGRFIASPAGKLHSTIIGIHEETIIVDASVYAGDMDALIVPIKLLVDGELNNKEGTPHVIKGITPCSQDIFRYRVYLNEKNVGDKITFLNAGAYNFNSDFCNISPVETEIIK